MSIIIVNWNTCDLLRDCLVSIREQTCVTHEIIVIDNASTDASVDMVRQEFPSVLLIANDENKGFAAANNQGLAICGGGHVLLLNPDTIILENAIDKTLKWLKVHPEVGCVGCQVLDRPGVIDNSCFADPTPLNIFISEFGLTRLAPYVSFFGRPRYSSWDRQSARKVDVVTGMFMLVPRRIIDVVGNLDEGFFIYAEEADWCLRIRMAGWDCCYVPEGAIIHRDGGGKSTSQIKSKMYVQLQKSQLYYTKKHSGTLAYAVVKAVYLVSAIARVILFKLLNLIQPTAERSARVRLSWASIRYLVSGIEPLA